MITIYPFVMLSIGILWHNLAVKLKHGTIVAYVGGIVLIFLSICGLATTKMEFRYSNDVDKITFARENADENVIVVADNEQELLYYAYMELRNYEQFVYVQADDLDILKEKNLDKTESAIVYILADEKERIEKELADIFQNCEQHYQPLVSDIWIYK